MPRRNRINVDDNPNLQFIVNKLQNEREELQNTVSDLRQLMLRLSQEHAKELEGHMASRKWYSEKIRRMQGVLEVCEKNAGHFSDMREFWDEFLA